MKISHSKFNQSQIQRELATYWQEKCVDGKLPRICDIDPTQIPRIVPHLLFVKVVGSDANLRLQYKMSGSWGPQVSGRDVTDKWIDDIYTDEEAAVFLSAARQVIESRVPMAFDTRLLAPGREFLGVTALVCPLSDDGDTIDHVVMVVEMAPGQVSGA